MKRTDLIVSVLASLTGAFLLTGCLPSLDEYDGKGDCVAGVVETGPGVYTVDILSDGRIHRGVTVDLDTDRLPSC